jgi:Ankyrin repeat
MRHPRKRRAPHSNSNQTKRRKTSSDRELPVEIWRRIAEFLPSACLYSIAISNKYPTGLSEAALDLGFHRRGFAALGSKQQLATLKDLHALKDLETLKCLLRLTKSNCDPRFDLGQAFSELLLDESVRRNDEELACLSISRGMDVNSTVGLVCAVKYQQNDMIDHFLAHGAEVDLDGYKGHPSSLRIACERQDTRLISVLLRYDDAKSTELHAAVSYRCYDFVTHLQNQQKLQAMKDTKDRYGCLPIFVAIYRADFEMLKMLKQYGCSLHVRGDEGFSLLHIAVTRCMRDPEREKSLKDIIEWLLDNGCDPLARDNKGFTPYDHAKREDAPSWALRTLSDRTTRHAATHISSKAYAKNAD